MDLSPPTPAPPIFDFAPLHSSASTSTSTSTNTGSSFPVLAIALIGIIATAFLLVSYYIFVIKCCLNWQRIDAVNRLFSRYRINDSDVISSATTNTSPDGNATARKGLDEAVIRSIPVIKFRKLPERRDDSNESKRIKPNDANAASYECAVCLCEFEEGERLRVIPNCCHAFHIDCIDVWLQSNANCPLCRSGISPSSMLYNPQIFNYPQYQHPCSNSSEDDDDDEDYVVIEIEGNNLDDPKLVSSAPASQEMKGRKDCLKGGDISPISENELASSDGTPYPGRKKKLAHVCSMGDEMVDTIMRRKDEEFQVQPIRRSISMDLSSNREFCLEIQEYCKSHNVKSEVSSSSDSCNNKVRRSIFSFGHGRSSRGSVQPVQLDP